MKIQLVKSDKGSWYSNMTLPVEFEVKQEGMFNYLITEGDFKGEYLFINHCINNEKYEINTEDKRVFDTGAVRDSNDGKIRPDLISPYMLKSLGKVLAEGAKHYGERNWEKGMSNECLKESLSRHYVSLMAGEDDEDHASKLIFNAMALIHFRDKK